MGKQQFQRFLHLLGVQAGNYRASEQLVAALGGLVGILGVLQLTQAVLGSIATLLIVPSMGASAVLIFGVPHSPLAQPWAVYGGHLLSALVGVSCQMLIPDPVVAAGAAVGGAIAAMHLGRCIHPPGGATALAAVVGGPAVHALGYRYALSPISINCLIILAFGVLFNYPFPWRRYPLHLMRYIAPPRVQQRWPAVSQQHVIAAMRQLNVVIDVDAEELSQLIQHRLLLAEQDAEAALPAVKLGHIYCNDKPGPHWSVRQIIDERHSDNPEFDLVIYKVLEGSGVNSSGSCSRSEFARWIGSERQSHQSALLR